MLTHEELLNQLDYNSLTGIFRRKVSNTNAVNVGDIAGYKNSDGYIIITVNGIAYKGHRLAWFYVHGYDSEHTIDHIDNNPFHKHHNWISNLREASRQCQNRNKGMLKNNTSGVKGVYWHKQTSKWYAGIAVNKRNRSLGLYENFEDAVCARLAGEQCVDWDGCDTCSPAYQYVQKMLDQT